MLEIAVAYNRYHFLGEEFLTWLWFVIATDQNRLRRLDEDLLALEIGNRIVLENRRQDAQETITIKGDDAGLEEGILSLRKGAMVSELNLVYKSGELQWHFTIKGESLNLSSLSLPKTGVAETAEELEGVVLEKAFLYEKIIEFLENLFKDFIKLRVSNHWQNQAVPLIKKWINST
ncbi:MAG: hypothetical protein JSW39_09505 [Desulfobacterales bacterium]|nr:MAG: hypothetical protein JSW39_09505 [Desulfobacterales bacterium]